MNKTDREYLKHRIDGIVMCTNGHITTILNSQKKDIGLTKPIQYKMIVDKVAIVKSEHQLVKNTAAYNSTLFDAILECYDYPITKIQARNTIFNDNLDNKIADLTQEVTLAGKRLLDKAVLGLIEKKQIPTALKVLNKMTSLAR